MRVSRAAVTLALGLCAACASSGTRPAPPQPVYSAREKAKLTYCVGLADTALAVASRKLSGSPAAQVKSLYAGKPQAAVTVPLVDKVYADHFMSSWDYAVSFFEDCAANVAEVPRPRVGMASYCLQRGMIAGVAESYKESGTPKEVVYRQFSALAGQTTRSVIDTVYAERKSRPEASVAAWDGCMAPISGG